MRRCPRRHPGARRKAGADSRRHPVRRGKPRGLVSSVFDHLLERTSALELTVYREKSRDYTTKLTSLVTALAMNYLYTDKFFEVD